MTQSKKSLRIGNYSYLLMRTKEEILGDENIVTFLTRCKVDFKFFCERMLNITELGGIHAFQLDWFYAAQNHHRLIIEAPSGFSKTEIMGVAYPLWFVWNNKNKKVLLISKTIKQAEGNLLQRMKGYIDDNEFLRELIPTDSNRTWNKQEIRTTNGCWIVNVPYSINIKGYRSDLSILDEADSYDEVGIYFDHVTSRMNPGGKIILITTPEGPAKLIGTIKSRNPNTPYIKTVAIVDENGKPKEEPLDKGICIWPERFSIQDLMNKREEMGENAFQKNYMCNIMTEAEDTIFSLKYIYQCYDIAQGFSTEINPGAQYFIGADFAISKGPRADYDAFSVIERVDDQCILKHIEIHKGFPRPAKVRRLKELYDTFQGDKPTKIVADASNMGTMVINDLRSIGVSVIPQNFHSAARTLLINSLANVIEGQGLIIPRKRTDKKAMELTDELTRQLLGFRRQKSDKTGREILASKASHDDIAISIAMAVQEASKMKKLSCIGISRS
jgi:hypothetical protein